MNHLRPRPESPLAFQSTFKQPNPLHQRAGNVGREKGGSKSLFPVGTVTTAIMKIQVVKSRAEIASVDPEERVIHLAFPISTVSLVDLMKRCPQLEAVQVPPSLFRNMFKSSQCLLDARGVKFFEGTIQGYKTDTDDHYTVDDGVVLQRGGSSWLRDCIPRRLWRGWPRRRRSRRVWRVSS